MCPGPQHPRNRFQTLMLPTLSMPAEKECFEFLVISTLGLELRGKGQIPHLSLVGPRTEISAFVTITLLSNLPYQCSAVLWPGLEVG